MSEVCPCRVPRLYKTRPDSGLLRCFCALPQASSARSMPGPVPGQGQGARDTLLRAFVRCYPWLHAGMEVRRGMLTFVARCQTVCGSAGFSVRVVRCKHLGSGCGCAASLLPRRAGLQLAQLAMPFPVWEVLAQQAVGRCQPTPCRPGTSHCGCSGTSGDISYAR